MEEVLRAARELEGGALWLSVWKRNPRAIAFYSKEGFTIRGDAVFRVGTDLQSDHIMVRELDEDGSRG
jgi:ribosomal protein S18 acetylase RimI-like enzyme